MGVIDYKEDLFEVYLDGLKNCINEAGLVYKKGYNDPMSRDIPARIKYRSLFGIGRNLATIAFHHNSASKIELEFVLVDKKGEQKLVDLAETIERELGIGVMIYK